jgi:hypothetical protein
VKRIKNLGLAVVTALALTAVLGAAGASATSFVTEKAPAAVTSTVAGGTPSVFTFGDDYGYCSTAILSGASGSTHAAQLFLVPSNLKCNFGNFTGESSVKLNGCELDFHPGAKVESNGTFDIVCPAGNAITFEPSSSKGCLVTVPAQTGLLARYSNAGGTGSERKVKVNIEAGGINYSQVSGSVCGPTGSFTDGTWTGSATLQASSEGSPVGMYMGNNPISISGAPPKLVAEGYPVRLAGTQATAIAMTLQGGTVKCTTTNFNSSASGPTAQLAVGAEYGGCTVFGLPGAMNMNECTYTLNVLNQAPVGSTYAGHADIACPVGRAIEIIAYTASNNHTAKCTVTIPGQTTDSGGLTFTNEPTSAITLGLGIKGIDYHKQEGSGLGRCTTGDYTDGTYTGTATLEGL